MKPFAPDWRLQFPHRTNVGYYLILLLMLFIFLHILKSLICERKVMVPIHTASMMKLVSGRRNPLLLCWWSLCTVCALLFFWLHYVVSFVCRTQFHRHVDTVYAQVLPSDYTRSLRVALLAAKALLTGKSVNHANSSSNSQKTMKKNR